MINEAEVLKRGYAKTKEEWWFLFNDAREGIERMMINFFNPHELKNAREHIENRDADKLWGSLSALWHRLPDSPIIHTFDGFSRLCDLCSDFPHEEEEGE